MRELPEQVPVFSRAFHCCQLKVKQSETAFAFMVAQLYSPSAQWSAIAQLSSELSIPVIGNGDIFEASDAVRMMRETGCAGVCVCVCVCVCV